MKKLFSLFFALVATIALWAYDFQSSDLYYNITSSSEPYTVEVTSGSLKYAGSVTIHETVTYDGITYSVTSIGNSAFAYCSSLTSVTIGNSVTSIGNEAFYYCQGLTSVTIGNSVTSIGNMAFWDCESLTSITLGKSVTSIGEDAFSSCSSLTSITIPNSVTSIGNNAFRGCSSLTSVTIGNSLTSIGSGAFGWCSSLTSIVVEEGNTMYDSRENCNALIETASNTLITGCKNTIIPNSVTSIGEGAFMDCSGLTSITIPNSVTSIGDYAFYYCYNLTSITIPNSVTSIGENAFVNCSSLTSITIPNSVISIGDWAFAWCESLTFVTLGNSVTSIGKGTFATCTSLTSVTIGSGVTSIGDDAFSGCNIQEVTSYVSTPPAATSCGINPTAATLYVPAEYLEAYQNAVWWEDFKEIRAIVSNWDVEFVDWDGTILATIKVPDGEAATAPADPTREGYTFIGWDKDFSSVTEDMTITALYQINRYGVRFYDWDNTLLKTDSVNYQSAATAPDAPTREGYTFIGWDKDFSSITADLDVHAQYEIGADKDLTVVYSDRDNNEISTQTLTFRIPLAPEIEGFTFLYWQPVAAPINDMITIQAVYEATTAAPEVYVNPSNPAQKLIRNGQVYILHEEKMYTISGQAVK